MLKKVVGKQLDIDDKKAEELENMIINAGVSCFNMGKKGLAYVSKIERGGCYGLLY